MIRLVWAVLCRSSSIDKNTNSLSLFDILEAVQLIEPITEPGTIPITLQLVTLWTRSNPAEPEKATVRVQLQLPSGNPTSKGNIFQIDLTNFKRLRHTMSFGTFPIIEKGQHEFVIDVQSDDGSWHTVNKVPFTIEVQAGKAASA